MKVYRLDRSGRLVPLVDLVPEGRARVGDVYVASHGEIRQVVSIRSAHEFTLTSDLFRKSPLSAAMRHGDTTGRERQRLERHLAKVRKRQASLAT